MTGLGINDREILKAINKVKELEVRVAELEKKVDTPKVNIPSTSDKTITEPVEDNQKV